MRAIARQAGRNLVRSSKRTPGAVAVAGARCIVRRQGTLFPCSASILTRYAWHVQSSESGLPLPEKPCTRYTAVSHPEDPASISPKAKALLDRSNAYILPVYARPPIVLDKGKGAYVWDVQGRQYLDFSAGIAVNALGHGDEGLVEVSVLDAFSHLCAAILPFLDWVYLGDVHANSACRTRPRRTFGAVSHATRSRSPFVM